jgi:acetoin utilization protein AcuB
VQRLRTPGRSALGPPSVAPALLYQVRMSKTEYLVRDCMTPAPETVRAGLPIAEAHRMMRARGVRHLPVLEGGKLVGIVSQRDLYLIESLKGVDPEEVAVEEAMSPNVWSIPPETPLAEAAQHMADHKDGCAVVADGDRLLGVFTTTDAMRVLAEVLGHKSARAARRPARTARARR